jgi:hypothetical protein
MGLPAGGRERGVRYDAGRPAPAAPAITEPLEVV